MECHHSRKHARVVTFSAERFIHGQFSRIELSLKNVTSDRVVSRLWQCPAAERLVHVRSSIVLSALRRSVANLGFRSDALNEPKLDQGPVIREGPCLKRGSVLEAKAIAINSSSSRKA